MKWNAEGQKICIAYEDGMHVCNFDTYNCLWGKFNHFLLQFLNDTLQGD